MKKGQKKSQPQPAPAAPVIPPYLAALEIVKSVRPDGSYVCIHDQELTECDECGPIALLADEEAQIPEQPEALQGIKTEFGPSVILDPNRTIVCEVVEESSGPAPAGAACPKCGQTDVGQTGEHACAMCGLPTLHDDPAPVETLESMPEDLSVACAALGLASEHVLTHAIRGDGSVSIVTRGGARLAWPCSEEQRQVALALTDQQRDGLIRDGEGNIMPRGKWLTTPHKF